MDLLKRVYSELVQAGIEVKINKKGDELIFKNCPFCSNSNWNLEVNLIDKFVFNCWACNTSGVAYRLFVEIYNVLSPKTLLDILNVSYSIFGKFKENKVVSEEDKKNIYRFSRIKNIEFSEFKEYLKSKYKLLKNKNILKYEKLFDRISKLSNWKFFVEPVNYKNIRVKCGIISIGLLTRGFFVYDIINDFGFKTKLDIFYCFNNRSFNKIEEVYFVEGFFDIFPFLIKKNVIIMTQTNLNENLLEELKNLNIKIFNLCLDKGAYAPLFNNLKKVFLNTNKIINIFEPNKHSPRESDFLLLKRSFRL